MMDQKFPAPLVPLPEAIEGPALLRDGREVTVRKVRAEDRTMLDEFLRGLSVTSLSTRFVTAVRPERALEELLLSVASETRIGLVMLLSEERGARVVAHAEYARDGLRAPGAEVAFLVADAFHGHGCATILLWRLAAAAFRAGIVEFHAAVQHENYLMLDVFRGSGFAVEERWGSEEVQVRFPIAARSPTAFERVGPDAISA